MPGYLRVSRHHVYVFRRRVPHDLSGRFPSDEVRKSLRTKDKRTAVKLARLLALRIDLLFDKVRSMPEGAGDDDDSLKVKMMVSFDLRDVGLGKMDIDYDPTKPGEQAEADRRLAEVRQLLEQRKASPASIPASRQPVAVVPSLAQLVEAFLSEREIARRADKLSTARKDRDALALFCDVAGADIPSTEISQTLAEKFEQRLMSRNLDPSTANNYMGAVSKFSSWVQGRRPEIGHKKLDFSEYRFKLNKRADEQRLAFTSEEVRSILLHQRVRESKMAEPHKFWLPYIAAYSGLRLEEMAQLNPQTDFHQVDGEVWVFDINDLDGKQLKNKTSRRLIPIHPSLIAEGILDYVVSLRQRGATCLFPKTTQRDGRLGKNAGKTVNRLIQKNIGIAGKSLHCFRHTVADLLKQARVDESFAAALLGHAHGGITYSRYGKQHPARVLLDEAVKMIDYGV